MMDDTETMTYRSWLAKNEHPLGMALSMLIGLGVTPPSPPDEWFRSIFEGVEKRRGANDDADRSRAISED